MTYHSNNYLTPIVTIYTYIVSLLYIVTILFLLRVSYTKLLYLLFCLYFVDLSLLANSRFVISGNIKQIGQFRLLLTSLFIRLRNIFLRVINKSEKTNLLFFLHLYFQFPSSMIDLAHSI